jgi:UV DNA damage endonuclease
MGLCLASLETMNNKSAIQSTNQLGLCCVFRDQPIKFRTTTVKVVSGLRREAALVKLGGLCLANAEALIEALRFCAKNGIGCFRINSQILPVKTHAEWGYEVSDLPDGAGIIQRFQQCGEFAREHGVRTCFHPDQFVVLNSPRAEVVDRSVAELEYQAEVAEWVGADVVNIHGGGAYGDKTSNLSRLSDRVRSRLTVENDDVTYTPTDLLPLCRSEGLPLVYDVHHHRCNRDDLSIEAATDQALATWQRKPLFHISSPRDGWLGPKPRRHHDFIDLADFPDCWRDRPVTIEVEAKAKEVAVLDLARQLAM